MPAELKIVFSGQDNAGTIINNISQEIHGVGTAADEASAKSGGFFSNLLSTAGGFLAANVIGSITSQIGGFISGGIEDARQANQLMAQTQAVITSTGNAAGVSADQVADYASSLSAAAGKSLFGDDQIQQSENLLLTFTNIKGKVLEGATQISVDMAQALGGAPKDSAIQLGKALNDPEKGITALTRVGVTFTEEQKNQIKVLQESGDMAGAQQVILAELNKEFGGSAAAAAKADGGMAQFKDQMGELGESLGGLILPLLSQLAQFASANLVPAVQSAVDFIGQLADAFNEAGDPILGIGAAINTVLNAFGLTTTAGFAVSDAIQGVVDAFSQGGDASTQLGGVVSDLSSIWAALQPVIENVVNAVSNVVQAVFGVVQTFIQNHGAEISAFMTDAWSQIMEIIKVAIQLYNAIVPPILNAIAGFIKDHGEQIQTILSAAWEIVKGVITVALAIIKGVITAALQLIQGDWSGAWQTIQTMCATVVQAIISILEGGAKGLGAAAQVALDAITSVWNSFTDWAGIGGSIIDGIVTGITDGVKRLAQSAADAAAAALKAAKSALGISSPSKVFADEVGLNISMGIAQGITQGAPQVQSAIAGATSTTTHNNQRQYVTINQRQQQTTRDVVTELGRLMKLRRA